ncbi:MAG: hypothetical protein ACYDAL_12605 [Candidatus Dormibacteraceae bacterium]
MARLDVIHPSREDGSADAEAINDTSAIWPMTTLALCVAAVLLSQFALDRAADSSTIIHWFQHGILFGGGVGSGLALNALRIAGQSRA